MDTANVFFDRDAWAGLYSDELGKLTFGRQNTLTRDFTNNWGDPYGAAQTTLREGGYTNVNNFKQLIFYSGGPNSTRYNSAIEWKKKWGDHWITGLAYKFGSGGAGGSGDVYTGGSLPGGFTNGTSEPAAAEYNGRD
jgi:predicted porin